VGVETSADKRARLYEAGLADEIVERLAPHSDQFGGMDIVIDCVGSTGSLAAAAAALAPGGALVVLGAAPGATLEMPGIDMILREIAVIGTRYTSRAEIAAAFQLVASGHVRPIVGARFDLARLPDAFEAINANTVFGRIVVDVSEE
jgi:D-arabinose 1-dehydrogenase-like Zn-dependent alcohol dehydrogenase